MMRTRIIAAVAALSFLIVTPPALPGSGTLTWSVNSETTA